ncbi:hypothetical protein [Enhygromyxa salina]|uniref:hypothetical protein n=1 Tax=Enhygromyxa salina TaxID=215803 RepID=UPI0011B23849|nr:hypothetical protein [Enhygromyxa salina]
MLTLVQLSFDEGAAVARLTARYERRVIDPEASAYFEEAKRLLLRPEPNLALALMALWIAASREPDCYGLTHAGVLSLLLDAAQDTAAAELAAAEPEQRLSVDLQKRS